MPSAIGLIERTSLTVYEADIFNCSQQRFREPCDRHSTCYEEREPRNHQFPITRPGALT